MYKIAQRQRPALFARLADGQPLYLPVRHGETVNFARWQAGTDADLATLKTVLSPKGFFLPPVEPLYHAATQDGAIAITPPTLPDAPFVLFGVRACDRAGIDILDTVYLSGAQDSFYEARRKAACVVTLACEAPGAACFCKPFGIDAASPGGDVAAWPVGEWLYWQPLTEKGEQLTHTLSDLLTTADETDTAALQARQDRLREKIAALPYSNLPLPAQASHINDADATDTAQTSASTDTAEKMLTLFNTPEWDALHHACIACGTCAYLCPTCQCYDIAQHDAGSCVSCHRSWDSCLFADFTQMAHGNPRPTRKERFRQRYMHKLVYHPQNHSGTFGCVGCGRCVNKCPVHLNIVKVINALPREQKELTR